MKTQKFRAYYMYDERTENTLLGIEYQKNLGGTGFIDIDSDEAENPEKVRQAMKKKGAKLIGPKIKQLKAIITLLQNIEPNTLRLAMKPGFRGNGFVLGETMIGDAKDKYIWHATAGKPDIGQKAGSLAGWKKEVAPIVEQSSFAMTAVFIALAAPLVTYVAKHLKGTAGLSPLLSEPGVFNFSGGSGTGKTSLSRIGAGTFGSPDAIFKWDFSRPGLEGAAESRNDLAFVLDDVEKHVETEMTLKNALRLVGQVVPSGMSKVLSPGSRDSGSPERRWTTFGISSSPVPLDELAEKDGWSRTDGEKVRFINIKLPKSLDAGIFDRIPKTNKDRIEASKAIIKDLERGVVLHYGQVFPEWIKYLLAKNRSLKVQHYTNSFVTRVAGDGTGYQKRYAEKFGVLYAAGKLAIEAGILPWPQDLPWKAVSRCYKLAISSAATVDAQASTKIELLNRLLKVKERFPQVPSTGTKIVVYGPNTLGIRTRIKGRSVCAVRDVDLIAFAGSRAVAKVMRRQLAITGALNAVQGAAGTSQPGLRIMLSSKSKKVTKPRFWLINEKKLVVGAKA